MNTVSGFSKMSKEQKIQWLASQLNPEAAHLVQELEQYWLSDPEMQRRFDEFSENTLSNFDLPFGIAPNFLINGKIYSVPMVIEESSVVAAASLGAKFWLERGGFKSQVLATTKVGQVHFQWKGSDKQKLYAFFEENQQHFISAVKHITYNMELRGGGIRGLRLVDKTHEIDHYWQIKVECETCNAMGANFINSILEEMAMVLKARLAYDTRFVGEEKDVTIIMCILSNYTPECVVECSVECPVEELGMVGGLVPHDFARKFELAVQIARVDPNRAVTHNKGIMNGVDAVVLATGNDFRAIEACAHAYAARDGQYRSLSQAEVVDGSFKFSLRIPLAVGTVGGLTSLHPLAKTSLAILGHPDAQELMQMIAAVGLAQNFGAVRSLVTTGIQRGHMKLHYLNIMNQLNATPEQIEKGKEYFADKVVSFTAVRDFLSTLTGSHHQSVSQ